jgi:O-methyltransferase
MHFQLDGSPWLAVELREAYLAAKQGLRLRRRLPGLQRLLREVRPFTMVPDESLRALAKQLILVVDQQVPGSVVECGAWRGGTGILAARILTILNDRRGVFLCDSFEGLPPPAAIDGPAANEWARNHEGPTYFSNCRAELPNVQAVVANLDLASRITLIPGWFEESLPRRRAEFGQIAILRIDADWYASVRTCLDLLYDQVAPAGIVILDDYDTWDGCAVAVHEFLGSRKLTHRIMRDGCAFFRKY